MLAEHLPHRLASWLVLGCFVGPLCLQGNPNSKTPVDGKWDFVHYQVSTRLDPRSTEQFPVDTEISAKALEPSRVLVLDAVDLKPVSARLVADGTELPITTAPGKWSIRLPTEIVPGQEIKIAVRSEGRVQKSQLGLFRTSSPDPVRGEVLATQFEADGARRFFPCHDVPEDKATFRFQVESPLPFTVRASGTLTNTRTFRVGTENWREFTFEQNLAHSVYLVGIAVGIFQSAVAADGNTPISVWYPPGKDQDARGALNTTRTALKFLEQSVATNYPWPNLSMVAIPRFQISGMENTGSIHLNELKLLWAYSPSEEERRDHADLIAHEIAHQWFGNWVTLTDWSDLWLKEGFATLYGMRFADTVVAGRTSDLGLLQDLWDDAFAQDDGPRAHALVPEKLEFLADAYDETNYTKGAAFLRMVEGALGEQAFQKAVAVYLNRYAKSTATHVDFLNILSEVARRDLSAVQETWLRQAGHPILSYRAQWDSGLKSLRLHVTQKPSHPSATKPFWIRLLVKFTGPGKKWTKVVPFELRAESGEATISLPSRPDWILLNHRSLVVAEVIPAPEEPLARIALQDEDPINRYWAARNQFLMRTDWINALSVLENEPSFGVRSALLETLLLEGGLKWPQAFSQRFFALGRKISGAEPGSSAFLDLWTESLGLLDHPEAAERARALLFDDTKTRNIVLAAARAVARRADGRAIQDLDRAIAQHRSRGEVWETPLLLSIASWESAQAAARIARWQSENPYLLAKVSNTVDHNYTLSHSNAWASTLKALVLNAKLDEDVRAGLMQTVEDVDSVAVRDMLGAVVSRSESARLKRLARNNLIFRRMLKTAQRAPRSTTGR